MNDADLMDAALDEFRTRHGERGGPGGLTARRPMHVTRRDGVPDYVLVAIDDPRGLRGIVALGADSGSVETSAAIADPASTFLVAADAARAAAARALPDKRGWGAPFLAWRPCRESFDSLRPLWVVPHAEGEAFVTQNLAVSETLTSGRGG
jgi:hypothetical protein